MTSTPPRDADRWATAAPDRLTGIALAYLALPVLLYFLGWFRLPVGPVLGAMLGYALWRSGRNCVTTGTLVPSTTLVVLALAVAVTWSIFGGAGHFFYANAHDWVIRDAVLHDLVVGTWPPGYTTGSDDQLMLRAPVAYYLPAAVLAKLTGMATADRWLWLWTVLGITLFFLLLPLSSNRSWRAFIAFLIVVTFSGQDIVGLMFPDFHYGNFPLPGAFIDWWIKPPPLVSYWSNTSNLFWNPNHALPAWIAAALFFRHWRHPTFLVVAPLLASLLPLWSPFALVGIAPFLGILAFHWWSVRPRQRLDLPVIGTSLALLAIISASLVMPSSGIQYGMTLTTAPEDGDWVYMDGAGHILTYLENYVLFVIFEFGIIALLVGPAIDRWLLMVAVATLLGLPFLSIGPGNDLAMRASIPALAVLCMGAVRMLTHTPSGAYPMRRTLLLLALAAGTVTPYFEFSRALASKPWTPNLDFTLIDANNGRSAKHYVVDYRLSPLAPVLNVPVPLANAVDWLHYCYSFHPRNYANRSHVAFAWRSNRNDAEVSIERKRRQQELYLHAKSADTDLQTEWRPEGGNK